MRNNDFISGGGGGMAGEVGDEGADDDWLVGSGDDGSSNGNLAQGAATPSLSS
jgi:hypothetical protein